MSEELKGVARVTAVLTAQEHRELSAVIAQERERLGLPVTTSAYVAKLIRAAVQSHRARAPVFFDPIR